MTAERLIERLEALCIDFDDMRARDDLPPDMADALTRALAEATALLELLRTHTSFPP